MKMVSTAKLARAQTAIVAARPYSEKIRSLMASVVSGTDLEVNPLLTPRETVRRLDVVLFTSDRGLCGAYNGNLIKHAEKLMAARMPGLESVAVISVGRRGRDYFRRRKYAIPRNWEDLRTITPEFATEIAEYLMQRFRDGEADEVVLVYSEFQSALIQRPGDHLLLPISTGEPEPSLPYEMEPDPEKLLSLLVPRAVESAVYRALLENQAGEHGARMTAMDNATSNTEELIRTLTLEFNKARQAAITSELVEIVSGAEAL
jgi:F-type H+-transporting ATPase subunit gamma